MAWPSVFVPFCQCDKGCAASPRLSAPATARGATNIPAGVTAAAHTSEHSGTNTFSSKVLRGAHQGRFRGKRICIVEQFGGLAMRNAAFITVAPVIFAAAVTWCEPLRRGSCQAPYESSQPEAPPAPVRCGINADRQRSCPAEGLLGMGRQGDTQPQRAGDSRRTGTLSQSSSCIVAARSPKGFRWLASSHAAYPRRGSAGPLSLLGTTRADLVRRKFSIR